MALIVKYPGPVFVLSLLAGCTLVSSRVALEEQPCGSWVVCTPEDALTASLAALRTNGESLPLDCGVERVRSEVHVQSCLDRVRKVVDRLAMAGSGVAPIALGVHDVDVAETCLDTFISGNEASDCGFYSYSVKLPLVWQ